MAGLIDIFKNESQFSDIGIQAYELPGVNASVTLSRKTSNVVDVSTDFTGISYYGNETAQKLLDTITGNLPYEKDTVDT